MGLGKVSIGTVDLKQGPLKEVERTFLFIGEGAKPEKNKKIYDITASTNLDEIFGAADSELKTNIKAAIVNSRSENFFCHAIAINPREDDWKDEFKYALEAPSDLNVEGVVVCTPIVNAAGVIAANEAVVAVQAAYGKYVTGHLCVEGIKSDQDWPDYIERMKDIVNGIVAENISITPQLHGNNLGAVIGRLCDPMVTIADSPMRVATGSLVGLGAAPKDMNEIPLRMEQLEALSVESFSVPQWYNGYDGIYWGDHPMLAAEGSDFQSYEHLRITQKALRRIRTLLIGRIGNRQLNNTARSIAANKAYLMRPLRQMAQSMIIGGQEFPGEIQAPLDEDIQIVWNSIEEVSVSVTIAPYGCPKRITAFIALDLTRVGTPAAQQSTKE